MAITPQDVFDYHRRGRPGKIEVTPTKPLQTQRDLSLAYTPGVAEAVLEVARDPAKLTWDDLRAGRFDLARDARLDLAKARGTGPSLRYTRGDMRSLPARWTGRFDAVVNLFTSFGFFTEPADDARVLREFARVLAPGGVLIWHGGSAPSIPSPAC